MLLQTCVKTYIHACIGALNILHTCIHTNINIYIHAHAHTYIHTYKHTYVQTYVHQIYIHSLHTYIHTCIHVLWSFTYIHSAFLFGFVEKHRLIFSGNKLDLVEKSDITITIGNTKCHLVESSTSSVSCDVSGLLPGHHKVKVIMGIWGYADTR